MIIEKFKTGKVMEVYQRFGEMGRLLPEGLRYVSSWVADDLSVCYEVIMTDRYDKLEEWMNRWKDLIDFEVMCVISSEEAMVITTGRKKF